MRRGRCCRRGRVVVRRREERLGRKRRRGRLLRLLQQQRRALQPKAQRRRARRPHRAKRAQPPRPRARLVGRRPRRRAVVVARRRAGIFGPSSRRSSGRARGADAARSAASRALQSCTCIFCSSTIAFICHRSLRCDMRRDGLPACLPACLAALLLASSSLCRACEEGQSVSSRRRQPSGPGWRAYSPLLVASSSNCVSTAPAGIWTYRTTEPRMKADLRESCASARPRSSGDQSPLLPPPNTSSLILTK